MGRRHTTWMLTLTLSLGSLAACGDDEDTGDGSTGGGDETSADDGADGSDSAGDSAGDSGGDGGTDDPYGKCETADDCPVADSRCAGTGNACLPPCTEATDCPDLPGYEVTCVGETCNITCSVSAPCPTGMTCLGGVTCGWP